MDARIWNWDYQSYIYGLALLGCLWILTGLTSAKINKPHTIFHLSAGIFLILGGCFSLILFDSGLELVKALAGNKWIDTFGVAAANTQLNILKYLIPAVSIAFGTRFVGNWITAKKPDKRE